MANSLTVAADGADGSGRRAVKTDFQGGDRFGVKVGETIGQQRGAMQFVVAGAVQCQCLAADCLVEGKMMSGQTLDAATIKADQNGVHAVEAGA